MKLYGSLFLILLVLGEYKCAPVLYPSDYPMERRWPFITDCGFGVRYYPRWRPQYFEALYNDSEYDTVVDILSESNEKTSDKLSDMPIDKSFEKSPEKPLEKLSEKLSENDSEKLSGKPSENPLTPLIDIPSEPITEFVLPDEPLD